MIVLCVFVVSNHQQILNAAGMNGDHKRLHDHFLDNVLKTASQLQTWSEDKDKQPSVPDEFGSKLYDIIQNLSQKEVNSRQCV